MATTFIASLGTGMYDKRNNEATGYRETTYHFPNGKEITSRLFLFSILESEAWDIDQVIVVGSRTSSWDALIAKDFDVDDYHAALWSRLCDECEGSNAPGVTDQSLALLQELLNNQHAIGFILHAHCSDITNDTLPSIFPIYQHIAAEIKPGNDILLDITHGFRSMPMFLYQSLRFLSRTQSLGDVSIIYGEYVPEKTTSHVRDLSLFWEFSEAAEALASFKLSFSGERLSLLLHDWWPKGELWMKGFTSLIKTNYVLQIQESIRQLGNALKTVNEDELSFWKLETYNVCSNLYHRFDKCNHLSEKIMVLSELLEEKNLLTQAIIALQVATEVRVLESFYNIKYIGNYDYWTKEGGPRDYRSSLVNQHKLYYLKELNNVRNDVAHGGSSGAYTGSLRPDGAISKENLKKFRSHASKFFEICEVKGKDE